MNIIGLVIWHVLMWRQVHESVLLRIQYMICSPWVGSAALTNIVSALMRMFKH